MLKILNTSQIRDLDDYTIRNQPIASIDLMEHACEAFVQWFADHFDTSRKVGIVCGTGNNGGDGLGIARILHDWGFEVKVWLVRGTAPETNDFRTNLERVQGKLKVESFAPESDWSDRNVIIDAIFGSGLSRPAEGIYVSAIEKINKTDAIRVAVDIPSGLMADRHSEGSIVKATYTVSFQLPKLAFLMPENHAYVGEWSIVKIGLDKNFLKEADTPYQYVTRKAVRRMLHIPSRFDHKGNNGRALLVAGGHGKMGAAVLSSRGALRAGVGLLTVHVPTVGYSILQSSVPEAMVSVDNHDHFFSAPPDLQAFDVIGVGPGIGQSPETLEGFKKLMAWGRKMVIDADAVNLLGAQRELLSLVPKGSILTPHPGEFARLVGSWGNDFDRLSKQQELARQMGCVILLKGAFTSVALPSGKVFFNSTGNPGMATGGSGDVLTGILTALLAQGYSSKDTAIIGAFVHGLSGDMAAKELSMQSLIASDLVGYLPAAFKALSVS